MNGKLLVLTIVISVVLTVLLIAVLELSHFNLFNISSDTLSVINELSEELGRE